MARYMVLSNSGATRGESVHFVRDGFHMIAFILPVIWLVWHRLWLQAAFMFATMGLIAWGAQVFMPDEMRALTGLTNLAFGFLTALEGPAWIARSQNVDCIILARSKREAEEIYASRLPDAEPAHAPFTRVFQPVSQASLIPLTGSV